MDTVIRDAAAQNTGPSKQPLPVEAPTGRKIRAVFAEYETGSTSFFNTIYHFITDRSKFFMRADMEREVGKATMILIFVNICVGVGQWGAFALMGAKAPLSPHRILVGSVVSLLYPFILSMFGMLVMSITYRAHASWKRIYGIYAFSSIVYLLCLIPFCGMRLICFFLYCFASKSGFENVFGLDDVPAWLFALGLPILLFAGIIFVAGTLLGAAVGLPQLLH